MFKNKEYKKLQVTMVWIFYQPIFFKAMYCLQISIGGLSVICGIINLLIIYYMKVWNQFVLLVTNLCFSQLLFDMTALLYFCDPTNTTCHDYVFDLFEFFKVLDCCRFSSFFVC